MQEAPRNKGRVLLMHDTAAESRPVAVKTMPNAWVKCSAEEFRTAYPERHGINQPKASTDTCCN